MVFHHQADALAAVLPPPASFISSAVTTEEEQQRLHRRRLVVLLNKLTPTTFELHVSRYLVFVHEQQQQQQQQQHQDDRHISCDDDSLFLRDAVRAIVDRAAEDGPRYLPMYAELCRRLSLDWWNGLPPSANPPTPSFHDVLMEESQDKLMRDWNVSNANLLGATGAGEPQHLTLSVLVGRVGSTGEVEDGDGNVPEQGNNADEDDDDDDADWRALLAKKLYLNHMLFAAEMFKCGVVDTGSIANFVNVLCGLAGLETNVLQSRSSTFPRTDNFTFLSSSPLSSEGGKEVRLEALVVLLDRLGWKLEVPPLSTNLEEIGCWDALHDLTDLASNAQDDQDLMNRRLTNRLRFMLIDLLELRSKGWQRIGPLQQRKMLVAENLDAIRNTAEGDEGEGNEEEGTCRSTGRSRTTTRTPSGKNNKKKKVSFGSSRH